MGKENVAHNWRFLFENMSTVSAGLREIDAETETAPLSRISPLSQTLASVAQRLRQASISRLGEHNIQREVAWAQNMLNSITSVIEDGDMEPARLAAHLTEVATRIDTVTAEIAVHVDFRTLEHQARTYERKAENAQAHGGANASFTELTAAAGRAQSFSSFRDLMQAALAHVEEQEAETPIQTVTQETASLNEVRERHLYEAIGGEFAEDLRRTKAALDSFKAQADAPFTLVNVPLIVISDKRMSEQSLRASGIEFRIIPFTGIQHGVTPGGAAEQMDTFGVIFKNQLCAAFATGAKADSRGPGAVRGRGGAKGLAGQGLSDTLDPELTRQQLPAILRQRTSRAYVDVLAGAGRASAIVNRKLPGYRLVWLLREDQYKRMGQLRIQEVGLPFGQ